MESRFSFLTKRFRDSWVYSRRTCRPSLKAGSIVKVDRFESSHVLLRSISSHMIRLFDNLHVIANTNLELTDVVEKIHYVHGSDLTKEATKIVIRLLIDP
ncbi:hypothetical protein DY000_02033248 [Brassica cretica]|uniref:Uncharacterized protein n=1 Tax=Brassica cretica TaxID=69181 RepID=A0ABQ7DN73_BRACR|nr:hypothetical protein DY000_02033248 [Brassica cretica]